jgi:hypothetical protein
MLRSMAHGRQKSYRFRRIAGGFASAAAAVLLASQSPVNGQTAKQAPSPVVRVVYLVPADRAVRQDYVDLLEAAIEHVQIWFRDEMGDGTTFRLNKRVVDVVQTSHVAAWYSSNPAGDYALWFWSNVLADAFALTGGMFFDPNNIWVFYIDSDPACGQLIGGTSGVALVPANDLRGLAGEPNIPTCATDPPDTAGLCRWVGGLGHELGHALGLPHPPACEDSDPNTVCPSSALLWLGYITYPDTFLLDDDKLALTQSPFFSLVHLRRPLPACSDLRVKR